MLRSNIGSRQFGVFGGHSGHCNATLSENWVRSTDIRLYKLCWVMSVRLGCMAIESWTCGITSNEGSQGDTILFPCSDPTRCGYLVRIINIVSLHQFAQSGCLMNFPFFGGDGCISCWRIILIVRKDWPVFVDCCREVRNVGIIGVENPTHRGLRC